MVVIFVRALAIQIMPRLAVEMFVKKSLGNQYMCMFLAYPNMIFSPIM